VDEVKEAEERLRDAMLIGDADALDGLIDEALVFVVPSGVVIGKADDLAAHRSGQQRFSTLEVEETQITMHGDTAIAVVTTFLAGSANGQPFEGQFRYIRTWMKREGGWRIVAGSVSQVRP
jgi:ketosteroid isomerase-like protein